MDGDAVTSARVTLSTGTGALACLLWAVLAATLGGCFGEGPETNAPGVNITTRSGLVIADLRVASFGPEPYPKGSNVLVLARMVSEGRSDRLTGVSTPSADGAALIGPQGRPATALAIPAGGVLDLTADGPHILVRGLKDQLREGGQISVRLVFERAGEVRADVRRRVDLDLRYPPSS